MKRKRFWIILIACLIIVPIIGFSGMKYYTKLASPETRVTQTLGNATIDIQYCSPSKRNRTIFGELVPYKTVWRTGANEPTTLRLSDTIQMCDDKDSIAYQIAPGKYSIWTIPNTDYWTIILNSQVPDWGVNWDSKANHDARFDVVRIQVEPLKTAYISENFSIQLNDYLEFRWDDVLVRVKIGDPLSEFVNYERRTITPPNTTK